MPAAEPRKTPRGFSDTDAPSPEILNRCVHCGLCLPACPTYRETQLESSSPRGRIYLMRAVAEGRLDLRDPAFSEQMHQCLNCRACEPACPSGVRYGQLVESARAQLARAESEPKLFTRLLQSFAFDSLFTDLRKLRAFSTLLSTYQRSGLRKALRMTGLFHRMDIEALESLLPDIVEPPLIPGREWWPARGRKKRRVALLAGCVMSTIFAHIDRKTARVLAENECEVIVPEHQGCCGALHVHHGDLETGRTLARKNIEAFESLDIDAVIVNAAGCGAQLKEYTQLLEHDAAYRDRAARFSERVKDISEYLAGLDFKTPRNALPLTVAYQDACHLAHAQRITSAPRTLLQAIPQLKLAEMQESSLCCGSAGIYNIEQPEMAQRLGRRKIQNALQTGADIIVSANPGCMMQMTSHLRAVNSNVIVCHLVELLDEAYRDSADTSA